MTTEQAQHSFCMLKTLLDVPNIRDRSWMYYTGTGAWPLYTEPRRALTMDRNTGLSVNNITAFLAVSNSTYDGVQLLVEWNSMAPLVFVSRRCSLLAVMTWSLDRQRWILVDLTDGTVFECEVTQ